MYKNDFAKLKFILEMIEDIEYAIEEAKSITNALEHRIYKSSILMSLLQIGENLNKISSEDLQKKLPVKGAYDVRNFIAHDYEGVDFGLIEKILRVEIPKLKKVIKEIL